MSISEPLVNYKLQFDEIQKINPLEEELIIFGQYQAKLATVISPLCVVGYVLSQFLLGSAAHRLLTWNSILYSTTVGRSEDAICEVILCTSCCFSLLPIRIPKKCVKKWYPDFP